MDFEWIGILIMMGIVLFIVTTIWNGLGLIVPGTFGNIAWGGVMLIGALICIAVIIRPLIRPQQAPGP